jgi:hypothetical protein
LVGGWIQVVTGDGVEVLLETLTSTPSMLWGDMVWAVVNMVWHMWLPSAAAAAAARTDLQPLLRVGLMQRGWDAHTSSVGTSGHELWARHLQPALPVHQSQPCCRDVWVC